jgi:TP901 family phage tail tape measure protein
MPNAGAVIIEIKGRDKTGRATSSAKGKFKQLGDSIKNMSLGSVAALSGITLAATKAFSAFAEFDKSVGEISTLLDDVSENTLQKFGDNITNLAIEYGQSIDLMAKANYDAISAGFSSAAESAELLGVAAKLAVGGASDISATVKSLTSIVNAFGKENITVQHASDLLFKTVKKGVTTVGELSATIGRAAAIAPTAGVKFGQLSAAVATLTAAGLSTDETVVSLTQTMAAFLKPTKEMEQRLSELGFESGVAAIKTLGFAEAIARMGENASEADLAARFGNIRAFRAVAPLAGTLAGKFAENLEEMGRAAGATDEAFGRMSERVRFKMDQMKARVQKLMIELGDALLPVGTFVIDLVEKFTSLDRSTQRTVIVLGGLVVALKILIPWVIGLGTAIKGLFVAIGPAGWLALGVAALGTAFVGLSSRMKTSAEVIREWQEDVVDAGNAVNDFTARNERYQKIKKGLVDEHDRELLKFYGEQLFALGETVDGAKEKFNKGLISKEQLNENIAKITFFTQTVEELAQQASVLNETFKEVRQGVVTPEQLALLQEGQKALERIWQDRLEYRRGVIAQEIAAERAKEEEIVNNFKESQQAYFDLRSELLLTDKERATQNLADRLSAWKENWHELTEGQKLFTAGLSKIDDQFRTKELPKWSRFGQAVSQNLVGSMGHFFSSEISKIWSKLLEKETNDFNRFVISILDSFSNMLAQMAAKAAVAGILSSIPGVGAFGTIFSALFNRGGIVPAVGAQSGMIAGASAPKSTVSFQPRGYDSVPAMLTPGEAVIPKSSVANNPALVNQLIHSPAPVGGGGSNMSVSLSMNINTVDAQGVSEFVSSTSFRDSISNAINDGLLRLRVGSDEVEAAF